MGPIRLAVSSLLLISACLATPGLESRQAAVNKAIEQTKRRQSAPPAPQNTRSAAARSTAATAENNYNTGYGGRSETVDVERLNSLLRTLDKTWIMPRVGAKDPVGSNFQYKKTCASIYKARHGACQQLGFGTMCFNYCHERGEKLVFKCQDTSEASYCRQSATFDIFIAKYRKDAYKAKAYVHQMISRCFATAVCNTQTGILNSTLIEDEPDVETTTKLARLRITKPAGGFQLPGKNGRNNKKKEEEVTIPRLKQRKYKPTTPLPVPPPEETVEEVEEETEPELTTRVPARRTTTERANIWDKFTVSAKGKATPKYIPFWQRLLTTASPSNRLVVEENEEPAVDENTQGKKARRPLPKANYKVRLPTKRPRMSKMETPDSETTHIGEPQTVATVERLETTASTAAPTKRSTTPPTSLPEEEETEEEPEQIIPTTKAPRKTTPRQRHTFKPLPVTPMGPDLAFMKPGDPNSEEQMPGFWNKFQPGRWYQSIHYLTNTGR